MKVRPRHLVQQAKLQTKKRNNRQEHQQHNSFNNQNDIQGNHNNRKSSEARKQMVNSVQRVSQTVFLDVAISH